MNENVIKKSITSRPSSARDCVDYNNITVPKVSMKKHNEYPSCHHYGKLILNRDGLSRSDHEMILSRPKSRDPQIKNEHHHCAQKNSRLAKPRKNLLPRTISRHKNCFNTNNDEKFFKHLRKKPVKNIKNVIKVDEMVENFMRFFDSCANDVNSTKPKKIQKKKPKNIEEFLPPQKSAKSCWSFAEPVFQVQKPVEPLKPTQNSIATQTDNTSLEVPHLLIPQIRVTAIEDESDQTELRRNFRPSSSEFMVSTSLSAAIVGLAYNGFEPINSTEFMFTNPESTVSVLELNEVFTPEVIETVIPEDTQNPAAEVSASSAIVNDQNLASELNQDALNFPPILQPDFIEENVPHSSPASQISSALAVDENDRRMIDNGPQMNGLPNVNEHDQAVSMHQQNPAPDVIEILTPTLQLPTTLEVERNDPTNPMEVNLNDPNLSQVFQQTIDPEVYENIQGSSPIIPTNNLPEDDENSPNSSSIQQLNEIPELTEHDEAFSMLQQILAPEVDTSPSVLQLNEMPEDDELNQTPTPARNLSEDLDESLSSPPHFNNIPQTSTPNRLGVSSFHRDARPIRSLNFQENLAMSSLHIPDQNFSEFQFPEPGFQRETVNNTDFPRTSADLSLSTLQDSLVQESSSISLAALREYTEADKYIKSPNDVLVTVNNQNFNKIYVVRKFHSQTEAKEFCREEVSRRSMLFKVSQNNQAGAMSVKKLPKAEMKHLCGPNHRSIVSSTGANVEEVKISRENFTVQRLNEGKNSRLETSFPAVDIDVSKNRDNADQFNVTKFS